MLAYHLPGGRWEEADEVTREQTKLHLMVVAEPCFTVPFRKYCLKTVIPVMYFQEKEKVQRSLDKECVTRWGSTYKMLATLLRQQQVICTVLLDSEKCSNKDLMPTSKNSL